MTLARSKSSERLPQKAFLNRRDRFGLSFGPLAASPCTLPTKACENNNKKHPQTGGNSRIFFLGLPEHLSVLCLQNHAKTTTENTLKQGETLAIFFSGLIQALGPINRKTTRVVSKIDLELTPKGIKNGAKMGAIVAREHPKVGLGVDFEMEPQNWCPKEPKGSKR